MGKRSDNEFNWEIYTYKRKLSTGEWVSVPAETVQRITLEDGQGLQDFAGNFVTINKYLFKFWQPVLDDAAFIIYLKLRETLYGNSHAYPTIDQIAIWCGKSDRTVQRHLPQLEGYELVEKVTTFKKRGGSQHVNLYFVRRSTPFLPVEAFRKLSPQLQKHHHEYLADLIKSKFIIASLIPPYDHGLIVITSGDNLSGYVDKPGDNLSGPEEPRGDNLSPGTSSHPAPDNLSPLAPTDCHPNNTELNSTDLNYFKINNNIISEFQTRISKLMTVHTYQTWIRPLEKFWKVEDVLHVEAPNEFAADWIKGHFEAMILETFQIFDIVCKILETHTPEE